MYLLDLGTMTDGDASRGGSSSSWQSAVDVKCLDRPKEFHNEEARCKDWKFSFSNWMSLLEVRFSIFWMLQSRRTPRCRTRGPKTCRGSSMCCFQCWLQCSLASP